MQRRRPVPGATVTIMNAETGLERRAQTDNEGRFNFPQLSPGTYSVKLEAEGFEPQQSDHVGGGSGAKADGQLRPENSCHPADH